jgi:hypothetical protein
VYCRFKPDNEILQKMNLDIYILSDNEEEANLVLDFTSFLLRYHKGRLLCQITDLDYEDFSENEEVVKRIKRAEIYRNWVDIEDLANGYESMQSKN